MILVVDACRGISENDEEIIEKMRGFGKALKILVLNKTDKVQKDKLLSLAADANEILDFDATFMISATKGKGVEDITKYLAKVMPVGVWHYPDDIPSDQSMQDLAAEITREKAMLCLNEELPYTLFIEPEKFEEKKHSININQAIHCLTDAHKKIIIGRNAAMIKRIGEMSRKELTYLLGKKVNLFLYVKVTENWIEKIGSLDYNL